jgi:hypothetical protein
MMIDLNALSAAPDEYRSYSMVLYYAVCWSGLLMSLISFSAFVLLLARRSADDGWTSVARRQALVAALVFFGMAAIGMCLDIG